MQIVRGIEELGIEIARLKASGRVAVVPTMGALHAGHMALVRAAAAHADHVVATIFVNPMQFGAGEDLARYPRREDDDAAMLEDAGCDLLWVPSVDQIYPDGFSTRISVSGVSDRWEGEARPGHFDGVATVVAKLLLATRADVALFGEKDFQQLAVVRRMAGDLRLGCEIVGVPTVRDSDGLALSSRNAYLSADQRERALALPQALSKAAATIRDGGSVSETLDNARQALGSAGFSRIDYIALVDTETLRPLDAPEGAMRLIAAAVIGTTRLIDNLPI
ncbi:MAG: pantoate--beta-alanine ligase [Sphingomicrobium sp.]